MQKLGVLLVLVLLFLSLNFVVAEEDFEINPDLDDWLNKCRLILKKRLIEAPALLNAGVIIILKILKSKRILLIKEMEIAGMLIAMKLN